MAVWGILMGGLDQIPVGDLRKNHHKLNKNLQELEIVH